jgi:hypothetical protein
MAQEQHRHRLEPIPESKPPSEGVDAHGTGGQHPASSLHSATRPASSRIQDPHAKDQPAPPHPVPQASMSDSYKASQQYPARPVAPEKPVAGGTNKTARQPIRAEDLWPISEEPFRSSPSLSFGDAKHRMFPEIPRIASATRRPPEWLQERGTDESRRTAQRREDSTPESGSPPGDLSQLWPELPSMPDLAPFEVEGAMRQWARAARIDREQRGEF